MLKPYIEKLLNKENLAAAETRDAIEKILNGANSNQVAAFLISLCAKQETADEIFGIVQAMRERMISISIKKPLLDIVGTGGDGANTINISTGAAILVASSGVTVAKHGNKAVSSMCGSADILEALGVNINIHPNKVKECIERIGFGFCFAPNFHPAMRVLYDVRRNLGVATCFNILGPLLNPTNAGYLLLGVFNKKLVSLVSEVVKKLNIKKALIFHGNGLDELSCIGPIKAIEVTDKKLRPYILDPSKYGFSRCSIKDLKGGAPQQNAKILLDVFKGKQGPITDTLIFNAAVALNIYGATESIEHAISIVKDSIDKKKPLKLLKDLVSFTNEDKKEDKKSD